MTKEKPKLCVCLFWEGCHIFASLLTLRNSAMLEKYFWLASATFFSAACGFTISSPYREKQKSSVNLCDAQTRFNQSGCLLILPVEGWRLHWSWFLRNGLWQWTSHHRSCSASATSSDVEKYKQDALRSRKKTTVNWWSKNEQNCLPEEIWRSGPWWRHWPEPAWHVHCHSSRAGPDWSPDLLDMHRLQSTTPHQKLTRKSLAAYAS